MSYEPTVWVDGDHVTSAKLNKLEQGVNSMSYTPTVWNAGDVVTAEKLNKLEQGVAEGGGGGGSSDFTTAQVTIVTSGSGAVSEAYGIGAIIDDEFQFATPYTEDDSYTMEVPLYKGKQTLYVSEDIVVSGNATYDSEKYMATITGDCSLKGVLMY